MYRTTIKSLLCLLCILFLASIAAVSDTEITSEAEHSLYDWLDLNGFYSINYLMETVQPQLKINAKTKAKKHSPFVELQDYITLTHLHALLDLLRDYASEDESQPFLSIDTALSDIQNRAAAGHGSSQLLLKRLQSPLHTTKLNIHRHKSLRECWSFIRNTASLDLESSAAKAREFNSDVWSFIKKAASLGFSSARANFITRKSDKEKMTD